MSFSDVHYTASFQDVAQSLEQKQWDFLSEIKHSVGYFHWDLFVFLSSVTLAADLHKGRTKASWIIDKRKVRGEEEDRNSGTVQASALKHFNMLQEEFKDETTNHKWIVAQINQS